MSRGRAWRDSSIGVRSCRAQGCMAVDWHGFKSGPGSGVTQPDNGVTMHACCSLSIEGFGGVWG